VQLLSRVVNEQIQQLGARRAHTLTAQRAARLNPRPADEWILS
jgi:hypothetical protein